EIRGLPTDPHALSAWLTGQEAEDHEPVVVHASRLLSGPLPTPALRAALYDVLAAQPGATLEQHVTTPDGRSGVGVRFAVPGPASTGDRTLVFDQGTYDLLGIRDLDANGHAGWTVMLAIGRAASPPKVDLVQRTGARGTTLTAP